MRTLLNCKKCSCSFKSYPLNSTIFTLSFHIVYARSPFRQGPYVPGSTPAPQEWLQFYPLGLPHVSAACEVLKDSNNEEKPLLYRIGRSNYEQNRYCIELEGVTTRKNLYCIELEGVTTRKTVTVQNWKE